VWRPVTFRRGSFEECERESLVDRAVTRARDVLERHQVPPLADDVERHIDGVIASWAGGA